MAERRIDRIERILEDHGGRASVSEILAELRSTENNAAIVGPAIYVAVQNENARLLEEGKRRRFKSFKDGEQWGYLSLESSSAFVPGSVAAELEKRVLEANQKVDAQLRESLSRMHWRIFEDTFLTQVLEKLGFENVEITQPTRDGGTDAHVTYKRGLVQAGAIVSAKRWSSKHPVPVDEVRKMRGIKGDEDTAIIITSGKFSPDAGDEAKPSQNQRAVYLIDGTQLVDICKRHGLGVRKVQLPELLVLDEQEIGGPDAPEEPSTPESASTDSDGDLDRSRFRDEMLGDRKQGITADEIANLLGLKKSSVQTYLSIPDRRRMIFDRIRKDGDLRSRALQIVRTRRGGTKSTVGQ